jgi:hypothetical protein
MAAFSPAACGGIRSLPNALEPGFRQLALAQLLQTGACAGALARGRAGCCWEKSPQPEPLLSLPVPHHPTGRAALEGSRGAPAPLAAATGIRTLQCLAQQRDAQQALWSPRGLCGSSLWAAGSGGPGRAWRRRGRQQLPRSVFGGYPHVEADYGSAARAAASERAAHEAACAAVCGDDFGVRGCAPGLRGVPAFGGFNLEGRPFVETDHLGRLLHLRPVQQVRRGRYGSTSHVRNALADDMSRTADGLRAPPASPTDPQPMFGAFLPPGRAASPAALRGQAGELLAALSARLSREVPGFLQAFQVT